MSDVLRMSSLSATTFGTAFRLQSGMIPKVVVNGASSNPSTVPPTAAPITRPSARNAPVFPPAAIEMRPSDTSARHAPGVIDASSEMSTGVPSDANLPG